MTPFLSLDFVYTPSTDVTSDARYFTDVLGGELVFAVEGMGARGALIKLAPEPPHVLLIDHLTGHRPVLVYRVADIEAAMAWLEERGWRARRCSRSRTGRAVHSLLLGDTASLSTSSSARRRSLFRRQRNF